HLADGHGILEPGNREKVQQIVHGVVIQRGGQPAPDRRREHEAVSAESGGNPQPLQELPDDRLVIRGRVVVAVDEDRKRHVLKTWQHLIDPLADGLPPCWCTMRRIARGGGVAREHAPIGKLLCRERTLSGDDEWLEQPLADWVAQEKVTRLFDDRHRYSEWLEERGRVVAGGHHDLARVDR